MIYLARLSLIAAAVFLPSIRPLAAQESLPKSRAVASLIEQVIAAQGLVGVQAAIWHGDEMIYEKVFGLADSAQGVAVTMETRFLLASITKSMTGLLLHRLAEDGLIDLDAPIQDYVPEFGEKAGPPVTPRLLLAHRSGVRHYWRGEASAGSFFDTHYETATAAIAKFKDDELIAPPGTRMQYSSFGYTLLAAAVESVTDLTFPEALEAHIFAPLEMTRTEAPDWRFAVDQLAPSYAFFLEHVGETQNRPFQARRLDFSYNAGGGNTVSTAADLIRYGRAHFADGSIGSWHVDAIFASDGQDGERFGWTIGRDPGGRRYMHSTGASEAYQAGITIWPEEKLVVTALSNTWGIGSRDGGFTLPMHIAIARVLFAEPR